VECTDDNIKRMKQTRMGISAKCKEYKYEMKFDGKMQERRGYACQKFNGDWEIVPHPSSFR
jgi:surface antigen